MALLSFPPIPTNGDLDPGTPSVGQTQYQWSSADSTWRLVGVGTGVTPGTYGDSTNVGQFTVDATGRVTFAANVPIPTASPATVTSLGLVKPDGTSIAVATDGTISLDTAYTDTLYVQQSSLPLPISQGGTGQTTANNALNALLPSQGGKFGNFFVSDGTNASWFDTSLSLVTQSMTPPLFSTSPGIQGQLASNSTYLFYYDGTQWHRTAWDTTPW